MTAAARGWSDIAPPAYITRADPWETCALDEVLASAWRDAIGVHLVADAPLSTHVRPWRWLLTYERGRRRTLSVSGCAHELETNREAVDARIFASYLGGAELGRLSLEDVHREAAAHAQRRRDEPSAWALASVDAQRAPGRATLGVVLGRLGLELVAVHVRPLGWTPAASLKRGGKTGRPSSRGSR